MNFSIPELQLKDTAYTVRNKLKDLLTELKGFKLVTTCVLEIKKEKLMIKQYRIINKHDHVSSKRDEYQTFIRVIRRNSHNRLKQRKLFKNGIRKKLMPVAWDPKFKKH